MIVVIRISGQIKLKGDVVETLDKMKLRKKYTCVLLNETPENLGMIKKVNNFIAFGNIDEKTLVELIKTRAKHIGNTKKKIEHPEKIAKEILAGKKLEELGIKPFFGLHPARGGINTKKHYNKDHPSLVLGNHKDNINKLIMRML